MALTIRKDEIKTAWSYGISICDLTLIDSITDREYVSLYLSRDEADKLYTAAVNIITSVKSRDSKTMRRIVNMIATSIDAEFEQIHAVIR